MSEHVTEADVAGGEDVYAAAPTRPAVASHRARRPRQPRKVTRFTLDLEANQHTFLRLYAISNNTESSRVMRCLLWLLEADESLQQRVYDELFADEDE